MFKLFNTENLKNYIKTQSLHSSKLLFFKEESEFYLPSLNPLQSKKLEKGSGNMVQGADLPKRGANTFLI